jgi:hypothetical protein
VVACRTTVAWIKPAVLIELSGSQLVPAAVGLLCRLDNAIWQLDLRVAAALQLGGLLVP